MTLIPTTSFGSWANITPGAAGVSPESWVAEGLADYATDYDIEAITGEVLTQLQAKLPAGLFVLGNGDLLGPAYGPEYDALPEDVCAHVTALLEGGEDGEGGIDLQSIADAHDLTQRAAWLHIYQLTDDGRREPVDCQSIDNENEAHQVLRDLVDDLSAADLDCEPGTVYEVVVKAGQEDNYEELAAARVTAR